MTAPDDADRAAETILGHSSYCAGRETCACSGWIGDAKRDIAAALRAATERALERALDEMTDMRRVAHTDEARAVIDGAIERVRALAAPPTREDGQKKGTP